MSSVAKVAKNLRSVFSAKLLRKRGMRGAVFYKGYVPKGKIKGFEKFLRSDFERKGTIGTLAKAKVYKHQEEPIEVLYWGDGQLSLHSTN